MEKQEYSDDFLKGNGVTRTHLRLANEIIEHFDSLYNPETDGDKEQYMKRKLIEWFDEVNKSILSDHRATPKELCPKELWIDPE